MNLIIVESPTKARTLSRFLGKEYVPLATGGHIKDLPKSKLSIDVEHDFKPDYVVVAKKNETIGKIRKEAEKATKIYLATDPDREGEAIAKHVYEILTSDVGNGKLDNEVGDENSRNQRISHQNRTSHIKPHTSISRIVFHEITKSAIEEAIKDPKSVDEKLVDAQIARRVLDRLVGYKLSPLLWKKVRRGLSAGRVQSVAVRLIVEKEREIEAFKPVEYWEIACKVQGTGNKEQGISEAWPTSSVGNKTEDKSFIVDLVKINDKKAVVKTGDDAKKIVADLENSEYKVFDVRKKEVRKSPYPPFTTSTMTQAGARLFSWSAKKTMSVAQRLYEEGLITYHRTDSVNVSKVALAAVRKYIEEKCGKNYLPENPKYYKKASKLAQEAHEAIRPTSVGAKYEVQGTKFAKEGEMLYGLIWKRFVASQMTQSVFDRTTIEVTAKVSRVGKVPKVSKASGTSDTPDTFDTSSISYLLRVSGQIMKFDGWRKVIPLSKNEEPELPNVEKDEVLDLLKVISEQKFTQPPARFNEASLIKTLESLGIGRPSTYAPTITTIQTRQYVEKKEGRFYPTPVGMAVTDFLVKNFSGIVDYSFTAQMEDELDNVAKGEQKWQKMMGEFYGPFDKKMGEVEEKAKRVKIEAEKLGRKCPTCKKEGRVDDKRGDLVIRTGRFGKFISCSNFPDCKHTEKYVEKLKMKCPTCKEGDVVVKSTRKGKQFYGCSRYPDCDWASWRKPSSD